MSVPVVTVTVDVYGPDGVAIQGATVEALLSAFDVYQDQVVAPVLQTATTNASGRATLSLFPNTIGERLTFYTFKAKHSDGRIIWSTTAYVPNVAKNLAEISNTHPPKASDTGVSDIVNLPFLDQQSKYESYMRNNNTAPRVYTFPDVSGTVLVGAAVLAVGLIAVTVADPLTLAGRTLQPPAAGITIANPGGVAGDPTFSLANDLAAVEGIALTGMAARTALDTWTVRTLTGTANQVNVANGDGVAGNPTFSLPQDIHTGASPTFAGATLNGNVTVGQSGAGANLIMHSSSSGNNGLISLRLSGTEIGQIFTASDSVHYYAGVGMSNKMYANNVVAGTFSSSGLGLVGPLSWAAQAVPSDPAANGQGSVGTTNANGVILCGQGSTNDVSLFNRDQSVVLSVPTGTVNVSIVGNATLGDGVTRAHTVNGSLTITEDSNSGVVVKRSGTSDVLVLGALDAGSGVLLQSFNSAITDYKPLYILGENVLIQARPSAGNIASVANFTAVASQVNYLEFTGGATGAYSKISAVGSDTNVGLAISSKGTGDISFFTNGAAGTRQFQFLHTVNATRWITATGSNGSDPQLGVSGGSLRFTPKVIAGLGIEMDGLLSSGTGLGANGSGGDMRLYVAGTQVGGVTSTVWSLGTAPSLSVSMTTNNTKVGNSTATRATTEGTNHIDIFDGTAPVGTLTNGISLYSTAGELRVMDAAGNATLLSPHSKDGRWIHEETNYFGRHLHVDMEGLMSAIDAEHGWGFVRSSMPLLKGAAIKAPTLSLLNTSVALLEADMAAIHTRVSALEARVLQ